MFWFVVVFSIFGGKLLPAMQKFQCCMKNLKHRSLPEPENFYDIYIYISKV